MEPRRRVAILTVNVEQRSGPAAETFLITKMVLKILGRHLTTQIRLHVNQNTSHKKEPRTLVTGHVRFLVILDC